MKKNSASYQKGFSVIELVLVLVIVGLIGFIGYYVWHAKSNADKNLSSAADTSSKASGQKASLPASSKAYDGWKGFCSTVENACFNYPSDWAFDDSNSTVDQDILTVTGASGVQVAFNSDISGLGGACDPGSTPHIYIHKIVAVPNVSGLSVVEYGDQSSTIQAGISDDTKLKTGDTGDCLLYTTFVSKKSGSRSLMFSASKPDSGDTGTLSAGDLSTIELILKSYHYNPS